VPSVTILSPCIDPAAITTLKGSIMRVGYPEQQPWSSSTLSIGGLRLVSLIEFNKRNRHASGMILTSQRPVSIPA
jgi:hypothetical protein